MVRLPPFRPVRSRRSVLLFAVTLACASGCLKPDLPPTFFNSAAQRDAELRNILETRSFTAGRPTTVHPAPDGRSVLFLRSGPRDRVQALYEFDVESGRTRRILTADAILHGADERLTPEEKARRERQRITAQGLTSYQLSEDAALLLVPLAGRLYVIERKDGAVRELPGVRDALDARFSPDGRFVSYVFEHDLYCIEWRSGEVRRLTTGGTEDTPNAEAEFVAQEEMDRHTGYWWSPDSTMIAFQQTDQRHVERLHIPDPAHPNRPPQAWHYPRAGTENARVGLAVLALQGGTPVPVEWDAGRYPYLAAVQWERDAPLTLTVQSRDQKDLLVLRADPADGRTTELIREHDDAWVNLEPGLPRWLPGGREFLWITERDGQRRLWLHRADGTPVRALNDDSFRLRRLIDADETRRIATVSGSHDPSESHIYELSLDALAVRRLTAEPGQHSRQCSKNHAIFVRGYSDLTERHAPIVCRADGTEIAPLPETAESPPHTPNVEVTRVGPRGEFDAAIVRPHNFIPVRRYPVIVSVYGGPSGGVVHKSARAYLLQQWYADQGFIVVSADNRGVANRGRAWERAIYGRLTEVPLDDQVAALRALGAKYPELDLTRVGITGWSFGGTMAALAVIRRGDVFHAGAAGAPVTDWTDYDTHYTERYLNTPQHDPEAYRRASVLSCVEQLRRPLLIIHGTADDNVYFGNSLRLADALFRAGKSFELLPLAGYTHMVPDPQTRIRVEARIADFFRRHLRGEPNP